MTRYIKLGLTLSPGAGLTLANVQGMEAAFRAAFPGGKLTWGLNDQVSGDSAYSDIWAFLQTCHANHGDSIAYYVGFPCRDNSEATAISSLDTHIPWVRDNCNAAVETVCSWFLPAGVLAHLKAQWGIGTVWGQVWSQTNVDGFSGDGSVNCPYYPSTTHGLVPAQTEGDRLDVLVQDSISQGLWEAMTDGNAGRVTVHPVDAATLATMQRIAGDYMGFPGPVRWVNSMVEVDWVNDTSSTDSRIRDQSTGEMLALQRWKDWVAWLAATYPDAQAVTVPEFGTIWRAAHPNNDFAAAQSAQNPADSTQSVYWLHTARYRAALVRRSTGIELRDLTRYRAGIAEPTAPAADWTVPQVVGQKGASHPSNPYLVGSYPELAPLYRGHPDLFDLLR